MLRRQLFRRAARPGSGYGEGVTVQLKPETELEPITAPPKPRKRLYDLLTNLPLQVLN